MFIPFDETTDPLPSDSGVEARARLLQIIRDRQSPDHTFGERLLAISMSAL
jgi:hypothetical protein